MTLADHLFAFSPSIQFRSKNIAPKYNKKIRSKYDISIVNEIALSDINKSKNYPDLIRNNIVNKVTSEYCKHALLVCLDDKIEKETVANLELGDNDIFICLDSAISTEDKLRLSDKGLIKTI